MHDLKNYLTKRAIMLVIIRFEERINSSALMDNLHSRLNFDLGKKKKSVLQLQLKRTSKN